MGLGGQNLGEHLVSRRRLADDRHLGARRDETLEPLADDQSIVGEEQPDQDGLRMTRSGGWDSSALEVPKKRRPR